MKIGIVTGASSGIGREFVYALDKEFTLDEIKQLLDKYPNIELFISVNKNIFNDEINDLENKYNL